MFTLISSTIIPVNISTLYLTDFFKESATAFIETPYFNITNKSKLIRFSKVKTRTPLERVFFLKSSLRLSVNLLETRSKTP